MTRKIPIQLTVNGRARTIEVAAHHTLLDVLRDDLQLTGTKECCLVGECGACTVGLESAMRVLFSDTTGASTTFMSRSAAYFLVAVI